MSLVAAIEEEMLEIESPITFDDIASLTGAKELLNEAVTLPLLIPEFFVGIREPWKVRKSRVGEKSFSGSSSDFFVFLFLVVARRESFFSALLEQERRYWPRPWRACLTSGSSIAPAQP